MDIYHIWCDLKSGVKDLEFTAAVDTYLHSLMAEQKLSHYRITRRKLGLGKPGTGEFHLMLEFKNLSQLDSAFNQVASRENPIEDFHQAVYSKVSSIEFALYRDFPDQARKT